VFSFSFSLAQALGNHKKWEEAEEAIAQIEEYWKNDTDSEMHDMESMRGAMKAMGLEKELAEFDESFRELSESNDKVKQQQQQKKAKASAKQLPTDPKGSSS
jgi:hypothetical protein